MYYIFNDITNKSHEQKLITKEHIHNGGCADDEACSLQQQQNCINAPSTMFK